MCLTPAGVGSTAHMGAWGHAGIQDVLGRGGPVLCPTGYWKRVEASEQKELAAGPADTVSRTRPALLSLSRKWTNGSSALGGRSHTHSLERAGPGPPRHSEPQIPEGWVPAPALRTPSPGGLNSELPHSGHLSCPRSSWTRDPGSPGLFSGGIFSPWVCAVSYTFVAEHRNTLK